VRLAGLGQLKKSNSSGTRTGDMRDTADGKTQSSLNVKVSGINSNHYKFNNYYYGRHDQVQVEVTVYTSIEVLGSYLAGILTILSLTRSLQTNQRIVFRLH
jgi:hypothetical protein